MIQVKYPKIECPEYENNYFAVFNSDIREIQTIWDEYRTNNAVLQQFPSSLRDIILSNYEQLVDIYNSADIFLNLSIEETYGLTCVEAMSCGTPCIAYNKTALSEIVTKNNGILVDKDERSIIKINDLLKEKKGIYRKKEAKSIDTVDDMIRHYFDIYNKNN